MTARHAQCACGSVAITTAVDAQPLVVACHCQACQRRTGSPFGLIAYFLAEQVDIAGETSAFIRTADSGRKFTSHFCTACGTSIWFESERIPHMLGVAVGAFADADFPQPLRSVWEGTRHPWTSLDPLIPRFEQGATP